MVIVLMPEKAAYNNDKRPSIDRYGCPGAQKVWRNMLANSEMRI